MSLWGINSALDGTADFILLEGPFSGEGRMGRIGVQKMTTTLSSVWESPLG